MWSSSGNEFSEISKSLMSFETLLEQQTLDPRSEEIEDVEVEKVDLISVAATTLFIKKTVRQ